MSSYQQYSDAERAIAAERARFARIADAAERIGEDAAKDPGGYRDGGEGFRWAAEHIRQAIREANVTAPYSDGEIGGLGSGPRYPVPATSHGDYVFCPPCGAVVFAMPFERDEIMQRHVERHRVPQRPAETCDCCKRPREDLDAGICGECYERCSLTCAVSGQSWGH